jgi:hypothetical protein
VAAQRRAKITTTVAIVAGHGHRWGCGDVVRIQDELLVIEGVEFGDMVDGFGIDTLTVHSATRVERLRARLHRWRNWLRYRRPLWTYWPPWGD